VSRSTTTDLAAAAHALAVYQGPSWTVDEVELVASDLGAGPQGSPVHTPVARFPLGGR
jgi:RNA 2',3'-cyclic 3'-phosphodiesterase